MTTLRLLYLIVLIVATDAACYWVGKRHGIQEVLRKIRMLVPHSPKKD